MGASNCLYLFDYKMTKSDILKKWKKMQDEARSYNGTNPYNGTISTMAGGIRFFDEQLENQQEADQWVMDNHEKWENAVAVSFFVGEGEGDLKWAIGGWCAE